MKFLEFLQDDNGRYSFSRLATFSMILWFLADWTVHIVRNVGFDPSLAVVGLIAAGLGFKAWQKKFE